jgi:ABC-type branched-subunit amino acid transport system substrate-binding protein
VATASDPNGVGAATCTYFTQDRPVVAVFSPITLMDVQSFRACFAKAKVPLFSASVAAVDTAVAKTLDPYFYQSVAPAYDYLVGPFVQRLVALGWFGGWNAATGSAGPAKAKVGVIVKDDEVGVRVAGMLTKAITNAGYPGTEVYRYGEGQSDFSPAVLQFRGRDVTHVIVADSSSLTFAIAANSQGYRPRWGVTSFNAPVTFLDCNAPNQMNGALGVGWSPSLDVADARDPGDTSVAETECKSIMAKGGQTFGGKRLAEAVAFAYCDGFKLIVEGATAGGGLTGPAISSGIQAIAPRFSNAFSFATGLGPGRLFLPGAVRDLGWDSACGCFRYKSATNIKL